MECGVDWDVFTAKLDAVECGVDWDVFTAKLDASMNKNVNEHNYYAAFIFTQTLRSCTPE